MKLPCLLVTLLILAVPAFSFPHLSLSSINPRSLEARRSGCGKRDLSSIPKYMCYWKGAAKTSKETAETKAYQAEEMKKLLAAANGNGTNPLEKACDPVTGVCP